MCVYVCVYIYIYIHKCIYITPCAEVPQSPTFEWYTYRAVPEDRLYYTIYYAITILCYTMLDCILLYSILRYAMLCYAMI